MKHGLANRGNWAKLKQVMARAEAGETLNIGFLGGSITQGSLSSTPQTCYAYLVYDWWCKAFPKAKFNYINGGIGGTTSHFGGARAWSDVLMYRPDVVVVDFTVNDDATEFFEETFEGLIRRLLQAPSAPALVIMNNVCYDTGVNAQAYHNRIGAHYGIPCVSMKDSIYAAMEAGELVRGELTPDDLHPNDKGHALVAGQITALLEEVKADWKNPETAAEFPAPLTENAYEASARLQIQDNCAQLKGFMADTVEKKGIWDNFRNGWTAEQVGDSIVFELECSCLAVQYRKSVEQPVPVAAAVIDGDEANAVVLDGNFDQTWGDCLYLEPLLHHGEKKMHRLEIRVTDAQNVVRPFYLVSVIYA